MNKVAHGTKMLVPVQQKAVIWIFLFGSENKGAHGTDKFCVMQKTTGATMFILGLFRTAARDEDEEDDYKNEEDVWCSYLKLKTRMIRSEQGNDEDV
jgi:hypothetical protein